MNNFTGNINFKRYFVYALVIKGLLFLAFSVLFNLNNPDKCVKFVFTYCGDAGGYIDPIVNLIDKGEYYEFNGDKNVKVYAARMPGMLPVLGPLYYLFGLKWALAILALLQYVLDALCCVLLGRIALKLFGSENAFYITFFFYVFSTIVSVTSHYAVSEFLCTSFGIIAFYYAVFARNTVSFFLAGLFAAWAVFFRPTAIILLFVLPVATVYIHSGTNALRFFYNNKARLLIFLIPFLVTESAWVARNYKIYNKPVATNNNLDYFGDPAVWSVFNMLMDLGGDLQSWNPDSEMRWFNNKPTNPDYDSNYAQSNPFPNYLFNAGISFDELKLLRQKYQSYELSDFNHKSKETEIDSISRSISNKLRQSSPINFFITTRLRVLKTLLFIKRPYGFTFSNNGIKEKGLRAWHFISYYVILLLAIAGILIALHPLYRKHLVVVLFCLFHVILYGCIIRVSENRYLVPIYPFAILIASASIIAVLDTLRKKRFPV